MRISRLDSISPLNIDVERPHALGGSLRNHHAVAIGDIVNFHGEALTVAEEPSRLV
jgi:hypothetical protein